MKRALLFTVIVAALFIGCETEVIQPIVVDQPIPKPSFKVLKFSGALEYTGKGGVAEYVQTEGEVRYILTKLASPAQSELAKGSTRETFELTLEAEANLRSMSGESGLAWKIAGASLDRVALDETDDYSIRKRYQIDRMGSEQYLNLQFIVTKTELRFDRMWITGGEIAVP